MFDRDVIGREIEILQSCCGPWGNAHPGHRWTIRRDNFEQCDDLVKIGLAKLVPGVGEVERVPLTVEQMADRERILIFCASGKRLEPAAVESVLVQRYDGFIDRMFTRDNPYVDGNVDRNVQLAYAKMRDLVVREGYKKVLVIEADMIVPSDALEKMLAVDAPVVTGLYAMRREPYQANVWQNFGGPSLGRQMTWPEVQSVWGQTIPCSGGSTGIFLIDRSVLGDFPWMRGHSSAPDYDYMLYCVEHKIKQMAELSVVCGHIKPGGDIVWPDRETGFKIERRKAA